MSPRYRVPGLVDGSQTWLLGLRSVGVAKPKMVSGLLPNMHKGLGECGKVGAGQEKP